MAAHTDLFAAHGAVLVHSAAQQLQHVDNSAFHTVQSGCTAKPFGAPRFAKPSTLNSLNSAILAKPISMGFSSAAKHLTCCTCSENAFGPLGKATTYSQLTGTPNHCSTAAHTAAWQGPQHEGKVYQPVRRGCMHTLESKSNISM